jgi:Ca2+-binding RTX toxin-like protein
MANLEFESNDTGAEATQGIFGVKMQGQLSSETDQDFFKFTVTESTLLNLKFSGASSNFTITVYSDAAATNTVFSSASTSGLSDLTWSAATGDYFILIQAGASYSSAVYDVTVKSVEAEAIAGEVESNGDFATASEFLAGTSPMQGVLGALSSSSDEDYYKIELSDTGTYTLAFNIADGATADTGELYKITLWDSTQSLQSSFEISADLTFDFAVPVAGIYYISIESAGSFIDNQYTLHVTPTNAVQFTLAGGEDDDYLLGTAANDSITGDVGDDFLIGRDGHDTLNGGEGTDTLYGGDGNDVYIVDKASDNIIEYESGGTDTIIASYNVTSLKDTLENITLATGSTAKSATGNDSDNEITGNELNNTLSGGIGDDTIDGGAGADVMTGGLGRDVYYIDSILDKVVETSASTASSEFDVIYTTADIKSLFSNVEEVIMQQGAIYVTGNASANIIVGNDAYNTLKGLGGNDLLFGGGGHDVLNGGTGSDELTGGTGADIFMFDSTLATTNVDTIHDFEVGSDMIALSKSIFTKFSAQGAVGSANLVSDAATAGSAPTALDTNDYLLFNSTTGELFYDADGSGTAKAAIKFAVLDDLVGDLSASDFVVV